MAVADPTSFQLLICCQSLIVADGRTTDGQTNVFVQILMQIYQELQFAIKL